MQGVRHGFAGAVRSSQGEAHESSEARTFPNHQGTEGGGEAMIWKKGQGEQPSNLNLFSEETTGKTVQISSLNFSVNLASDDPEDTIEKLSDVAVRLLRFMMDEEVK